VRDTGCARGDLGACSVRKLDTQRLERGVELRRGAGRQLAGDQVAQVVGRELRAGLVVPLRIRGRRRREVAIVAVDVVGDAVQDVAHPLQILARQRIDHVIDGGLDLGIDAFRGGRLVRGRRGCRGGACCGSSAGVC